MTTEQIKQHAGSTLSEAELRDADNLFKIFLQAWKNYSLYPEGHAISTKSLETLISAFASFFAKHGELGLVVEKERLLWQNNPIHKVTTGDHSEDFVFLLYRDGISWIEFLPGLSLEELALFFSILKKYRSIQEESEGDIVTELIDADLSALEFKAVDVLWQDYPLLDFSSLHNGQEASQAATEGAEQHDNMEHADLSARSFAEPSFTDALREASETGGKASQREADRVEGPQSESQADVAVKSITDPSFSETLWEISAAEMDNLQKMVQEEENWDNTGDVF
ncbi:MAG TPA: hypothetical protein DDX85_10200, partial [Nitrospiraceae bacterium]|nr:hypothetical protein [Nitrospiraceae bacterium]